MGPWYLWAARMGSAGAGEACRYSIAPVASASQRRIMLDVLWVPSVGLDTLLSRNPLQSQRVVCMVAGESRDATPGDDTSCRGRPDLSCHLRRSAGWTVITSPYEENPVRLFR